MSGEGKEKPWIVSLSDVESNYDFFEESLKLVEREYGSPIVNFEDCKVKWAGNNYKLIINGDLFQHGRLKNPQTKNLSSALESLVQSAPEESVMFTLGNHDVGMLVEGYMFPTIKELETIGNFVNYYKDLVDKDLVRAAIPGHNYTYVHAGQMNEWTNEEYKNANNFLKEISGKSLKSLGLNDINDIESSRGPQDRFLSSIPFSELSYKDKTMKLIGPGNVYLGDGTGRNPHAGIVWIRPEMVKDGPRQIVGHTGSSKPWKQNNLIVENTQAGINKEPSVVVEKPDSVYAITKSDGEYKLD